MTSLYQIENSDLKNCFSSLENYFKNEATGHHLHEVEGKIFDTLLKAGHIILTQFIEAQGDGRNIKFSNEEKLPLHSIKKKEYLSIFGKLNISRAYFWKPGHPGVCPLDKKLNLPKHLHSYLLEKWLQYRTTEEPYDQAVESISDLLNQKINKRVVQQATHRVSEEVENFYSQKQGFADEGSHIVVQADSKGVRMVTKERPETKLTEEFTRRAKGVSKRGIRKDSVVTVDYSINPSKRSAHEVLGGLMKINSNCKKKKGKPFDIRNKQVAGTMLGKQKAFENLADRLQMRDPTCAKPIFILIDGAPSLEKLLNEEFESRNWEKRIVGCCLDIVHATEYLWDVSTALYGEKSYRRVEWVEKRLKQVLNSKICVVMKEINGLINSGELNSFEEKRLKRSLTYFENHKHMMDYKKYLELGFPIASGGVEGACNNLVKSRTDRSGMQWTKQGANAVINLRSARCNKDWESYWEYYIQKEFEKTYGEQAA
jgi:hypothetical protein